MYYYFHIVVTSKQEYRTPKQCRFPGSNFERYRYSCNSCSVGLDENTIQRENVCRFQSAGSVCLMSRIKLTTTGSSQCEIRCYTHIANGIVFELQVFFLLNEVLKNIFCHEVK